jgi:hypothetical protein
MKIGLLLLLAFPATGCRWVVESQLPAYPPEGLEVAWWHSDCAPWDGPAVSIYLGHAVPEEALAPTYPHLRISIFDTPTSLPGESYHWDEAGNTGDVQFCSAEGTCQGATAVTVEFDDQGEGGTYRGRVGARLADGSYRAGSFEAAPLKFTALCG